MQQKGFYALMKEAFATEGKPVEMSDAITLKKMQEAFDSLPDVKHKRQQMILVGQKLEDVYEYLGHKGFIELLKCTDILTDVNGRAFLKNKGI
jgi:hypothetical protein